MSDLAVAADLPVRLRHGRDQGARWLLDHVADDGTPVGATVRHGWGRVPWALAVAGERDAASAVLSWAERTALTREHDLPPGPLRSEVVPMYPLAHLGYGAWLLERYDTAGGIFERLRDCYQLDDGGVTDGEPGDPCASIISTAQLGLLALIMGRESAAEAVHGWIVRQWSAQPDLPRRLYVAWDDGLVVQRASGTAVVDFTAARQAWFYPGIAAAFLAGYAAQTGETSALVLAQELLQLNIRGPASQFEDPGSVQICKFGWGVAAVMQVERTQQLRPHAERMANWFLERQQPDGCWVPSSFATPLPDDVDKLSKTAEHLMEMVAVSTALASQPVAAPV